MFAKELFKNYIYPMAVFSGGMIGVGFLSLPYIASRTGIWLMSGYVLVLTGLVIVINLIFCQISLKTPDFKRFPGFVEHYLGKWPKIFTMITVVIGTFGVLLSYLIVAGQFLTAVFHPIFSGSPFFYTFVYFLIVSTVVYFDVKLFSKVEFWMIFLLFLSMLFIFIEGFQNIKLSNIFSVNFNSGVGNFFLPYGPLLFALWGTGLIPETEEMLLGKKHNLKKIVTIATIIISVFYFLFILLILGISGNQTDQVALIGLKGFLGNGLVLVAIMIGVMASFTAFITQGIIFKKTLIFDLKIKHWQAFVMTCLAPMILFLLGLKSFISILSFVGGVSLGLYGILILMMYKKIGGKNIIIYPLSLVFLLGVIYEMIYFIK